jgi:hypothetical protein
MQSPPAVHMKSDFEELSRIFNANEVKYLIPGGFAVMLYTEPAGLGPEDFTHEGLFYQIGQPPVQVDILMSSRGARPRRAVSALVPTRASGVLA